MTPFLLLTFVMGALATAWLTRPLWQRSAAPAEPGSASRPRSPRSQGLAAALALFVVAVVGGGYAWVGAPGALNVGPARAATASAAAKAAPSAGEAGAKAIVREAGAESLPEAEARVVAMVERLAERLKTQPDDAGGWQMLGRSYAALGRHPEAIAAFRNAVRLRPDDPTLLAEYALSGAIANRREANGEPARLLARALELDPKNPKALALAGTLALDRRDYQAAVKYWERLAQLEPPDSPVGRQVQAGIAEARRRAGMRPGNELVKVR